MKDTDREAAMCGAARAVSNAGLANSKATDRRGRRRRGNGRDEGSRIGQGNEEGGFGELDLGFGGGGEIGGG